MFMALLLHFFCCARLWTICVCMCLSRGKKEKWKLLGIASTLKHIRVRHTHQWIVVVWPGAAAAILQMICIINNFVLPVVRFSSFSGCLQIAKPPRRDPAINNRKETSHLANICESELLYFGHFLFLFLAPVRPHSSTAAPSEPTHHMMSHMWHM